MKGDSPVCSGPIYGLDDYMDELLGIFRSGWSWGFRMDVAPTTDFKVDGMRGSRLVLEGDSLFYAASDGVSYKVIWLRVG